MHEEKLVQLQAQLAHIGNCLEQSKICVLYTVAATFKQLQVARASSYTRGMHIRGAIVSACLVYKLLHMMYRDFTVLYRYSKVWACNWQEESSQVVLKGYFKSKMRPRHLENVRRELNILGDLCNLRYIAAGMM